MQAQSRRHLSISTRGWTRTHWVIAVGLTLLLWFFFGWAFSLLFGAIAGLATFIGWLAGIVLAAGIVVVAFLLLVAVATRYIADRLS